MFGNNFNWKQNLQRANAQKWPITLSTQWINNNNRTEWSPIWSVMIQKQNQMALRQESNLLIISIITDRIGQHEELLQNLRKKLEISCTFS